MFKKGQSGNPNGRPKFPLEVQVAKAFNRNVVELALAKYLSLPIGELKKLKDDPTLPSHDQIVISIIISSILFGDAGRYSFLLDRLIGKVPEKIDIEVSGVIEQIKYLKTLPKEDFLKIAHETLEGLTSDGSDKDTDSKS